MVKFLGRIAPAAALVASLALFLTTPGPVSAGDQECEAEHRGCCNCLVFQTQPDTTYICYPVPADGENPKNGWEGWSSCDQTFCPEERDCILGQGT